MTVSDAVPAFAITAYKYPDQLARLVRQLEVVFPSTHIAVHVDRKVDIAPFAAALASTSAMLVGRRVRVSWGAYSMVRAELRLIDHALRRPRWTHLVLLSEQDHPLPRAIDLVEFLSGRPTEEFIESTVIDAATWPEAIDRATKYHLRDLRPRPLAIRLQGIANRRLPARRPPKGLEIRGGATWWCLTRPAVQECARRLAKDRRLALFFHLCALPEEMVFQTLLASSSTPYVTRHSLSYARFTADRWRKNPAVLTSADLDGILALDETFFARKFDLTVDADAVDQIDSLIAARLAGRAGD